MKHLFTFLLLLLLFWGCENKEQRPFVVTTNLWIGYSPLYFAEKKGWLRESNIKLIRTISLAESLETFKNKNADALCGTQYEIEQMIKYTKTAGSLIPLDRSYGGDYILSNRSIEQLQQESKIDVYLEVESVNSLMLEYFMTKHGLDKSQINLINSAQITNSKLSMKKDATLIITYDPYNLKLQKKGYLELGSTKDKEILVIDAIYAPDYTEKKFPQELQDLNTIIERSLNTLDENPKAYFDTINSYYYYENYEEFTMALKSIRWIYSDNKSLQNKRNGSLFSMKPKLINPYSDEH